MCRGPRIGCSPATLSVMVYFINVGHKDLLTLATRKGIGLDDVVREIHVDDPA
jgi:hypothetical protein